MRPAWQDPGTYYFQPQLKVVQNNRPDFLVSLPSSYFSREIHFKGYGGDDDFRNDTHLRAVADGGTGQDMLSGGSGDDILNGGIGVFHDAVYGNGGVDILSGGSGPDELRGGTENDTLDGGGEGDTMRGGPGDDTLYGSDGNDTLYGDNNAGPAGGVGHDVLYGGSGTDTLTGEDGNDALYGGTQTDRLYGGEGMDGLFGGANDTWDYLNGGGDSDRFLMPTSAAPSWPFGFHEDVCEDFSDEDARPIFMNGYDVTVEFSPTQTVDYTAQNWTDADVERTDPVLALLHQEARGPRLLETPLGGDLVIVRHGNADRGYNDGRLHMTQQRLQYGGTDTDLRGYLLHEIGHAWGGDAFYSGGTNYWGQFVELSGWTSTPQDDPAYALSTNEGRLVLQEGMLPYFDYWWYLDNGKYASEYAKTNEGEDFAESFAAYFTMRAGWTFYNSQPGAAAIPEKMDLFANWMAEL